MKQYAAILVGAGYAALGYADVREDVLMLARTETLGEDYHTCLRPAPQATAPCTGPGRDFSAFLEENGVLCNGRLDVLRLSTATAFWVSSQPWPAALRLDTQVISVRQRDGLYTVTYHTNNGIDEACAPVLLDTTAQRDSARETAVCRERRLHVIGSGMSPEQKQAFARPLPPLLHRVEITNGFFPGEFTATLVFSPEVTSLKARELAERVWADVFPGGDVRMEVIGARMEPVSEDSGKPAPGLWLPPRRFADPLAAFEAGVRLAKAE